MKIASKLRKNKLLGNRLLFAAIIIAAVFFAFYKLTDIPPGTQNDVIRAELTAEQFLNSMDGGMTSIRQMLAYLLLGGYWSYYLIDIFRGTLDLETVNLISRLPSALFFILGAIVWYRLLKEIKVKNNSILIFFLVFFPSSLFITYSHHIPLVAGYFFFASAGILFYTKFLQSKTFSVVYLALALVAVALATYTHGISIFFSLIFFSLYTIAYLYAVPKTLKTKLKQLNKDRKKNLFKLLCTATLFAIVLLPFVHGTFGGDQSLQMRDATSIKYLIEYEETELMREKIGQKIISYIHPNTLIRSEDIIKGDQPIDSPQFHDIKNPLYNQWVTTNLSPFGVITIFIYILLPIAFILLLIRKVKPEHTPLVVLFVTLGISYILLPIFPNFDNPSVAKAIVSLMFIPLGITYLSELASMSGAKNIFWFTVLFVTLLNAGNNLRYMYSDNYVRGEVGKYYQFNNQELAEDILETSDLHNVRIYLTIPNRDLQNSLAYNLSPYILNRIVLGNLNTDLIDPHEKSVVVTNDPATLDKLGEANIKYEVKEYYKPDGAKDYMLVTINNKTTDLIETPAMVTNSSTSCSRELFYPQYTGEFEYLVYYHRYFQENPRKLKIEECDNTGLKAYRLVNVDRLDLDDNFLYTTIAPNHRGQIPDLEFTSIKELDKGATVTVKDQDVTFEFPNVKEITRETYFHTNDRGVYSNGRMKMYASSEPSKTSVELVANEIGSGTYMLEFDYEIDKFGFLDMYIIDGVQNRGIPTKLFLQDYNLSGEQNYQTVFYLPPGGKYYIGLDLHNRHFNIDKDAHIVTAELDNIRITKLTKDNILEEEIIITPIIEKSEQIDTLTIDRIIPGITKITDISGESGTLVLNQPYSSNQLAIESGFEVNSTPVNGISQGLQITNNGGSDTIYLLNLAWVLGALTMLFFMIFNLFFVLYQGKNE